MEDEHYPDHHPNPTVTEPRADTTDAIEPTAEVATNLDVENSPDLRRSTRERKEPVWFGFEKLQHCHNIVTVDDASYRV